MMRLFIILFAMFLAKCYSSQFCFSNPKDMLGNYVDVSIYCADKTCLTKCCDAEEMLFFNQTISKTYCVNYIELSKELNFNISLDYSDLIIYKSHTESTEKIISSKNISDYKLISNELMLNNTCAAQISQQFNVHLLDDGKLVFKISNTFDPYKYYSSPNYCFEKIWKKIAKTGAIRSKYNYYAGIVISKVDEKTKIENQILQQHFNGIGKLISSFFLLLTLIVYGLLKQLRDHQGIIIMSYVGTLMIAYILGAVLLFGLNATTFTTGQTCFNISVPYYFFTLSSFFWLNIMSFEIWWTSRGIKIFRPSEKRMDLKNYLWNGLYGWGLPLLITVIAVIIEKTEHEIPKPHFQRCLSSYFELLFYVYLVIGIITVVNMVLFILTMFNIRLIKKSATAESHSTQGTANRKNQQRFWFYLNIAILMGVNWFIELLAVLLHYLRNHEVLPLWLYYLINISNILIGLILFVILVCRKSVLCLLCKKFNIKNNFVENYNETYTKTADQTEELQALH